MQVSLHGEHHAAVSFGYNAAIVAWLKEQGGCRWEPDRRCWVVPLQHVRALCEAWPAFTVADDVAAALEGHEEWQAMNMVGLLLNDGHKMHLDTATGRVWLTGPIVDEQPEWFAKQIERYQPALRRICERRQAEKQGAACSG